MDAESAAGIELGSMAAFARLMDSRPHPDEIVTAMIEGPLAPFSAFAGILLWSKEPSLRMIGLHGYTVEESEGFEEIPLDADLPITRAVREGEVIIGDGRTFEAEYTDERFADPERWERMRARVNVAGIVSVPVIGRGVCLGAYGFTCQAERAWSTFDVAVLDAVGRITALWMLHPDSGLPWGAENPATVALTARQSAILTLIAAGRTNASIAAKLGYSESTIKHEISRISRLLDVPTRQAAAERAAELGLIPGRDAR